MPSTLIALSLCIKAAAQPAGARSYLSTSLYITLPLALVFALAVLFAGLWLGDWRTAAAAALALTAWQVQETFRRGLIAQLRYAACIAGDTLTYIGQAVVVGWLMRSGRLSIAAVFLSLAIMATLGAAVQAALSGVQRTSRAALREDAVQFWRLGRCMLTGGAALNRGNQVFPRTPAAAFGPVQAA